MWVPLKTAFRWMPLLWFLENFTKDTCRRAWNVCGYFGKTLNWLVRYIPVNQVGLSDLRCRKVEKLCETLLILSGTWLYGRGRGRCPQHSIKREERLPPQVFSVYYPLSHDIYLFLYIMPVCNPYAILMLLEEEEKREKELFNSYTYTDGERYSSTAPTGGTRPMTSETGAHNYYRKKLRKVL